MSLTRRDILKSSVFLLGGSFLSPLERLLAQESSEHFFLQVIYRGGWDPSYLFDGRPLSMTNDNLIQNYVGKEPYEWMGTNGFKTLASELTRPLLPFKDEMTLVNGVHMSSSFDGHDQNVEYLITGNPFGGESFIPYLNTLNKKLPLDYIQSGRYQISPSNAGNSVALSTGSFNYIVKQLKNAFPDDLSGDLYKYVKEAYLRNMKNNGGAFSKGNANLLKAFNGQFDLINPLKKAQEVSKDQSELLQSLNMINQCFTNGVTRGALIVMNNLELDTHAGEQAWTQPEMYETLVSNIKTIFDYLKQSGLLAKTTISITSEFSRTMRQNGQAMDKTGTDHNPLSNLVILGGKGIKKGMVVGQSDFQTKEEELSKAHLNFDRDKRKVMGKPFDHKEMRVLNELPTEYKNSQYLTYSNLVNTIFKSMKVDEKYYRKTTERDGGPAAVVPGLLI